MNFSSKGKLREVYMSFVDKDVLPTFMLINPTLSLIFKDLPDINLSIIIK